MLDFMNDELGYEDYVSLLIDLSVSGCVANPHFNLNAFTMIIEFQVSALESRVAIWLATARCGS